jgi:UDPglucose--hexose-1-phosphate uridylyltransferase
MNAERFRREPAACEETMSIIRQDPTTKEWVILAPGRAARPHDRPRDEPRRHQVRDASCPLCPGNEALTPPELLRIPESRGRDWSVRVVPNKFPALAPGRDVRRREAGALFRELDGVGHHEVIVETPRHHEAMPLMSERQIERILRAYQIRYRALREDPRVKYVIIFKNHGERAGTSLRHSHSQLVATPVAPMRLRRKYEVAIAHYDDTGRCLYRDLSDAEIKAKARVVLRTANFVVFHPFASQVPFETWIVPRRQQSSFAQVSSRELIALARVLRTTLHALYETLGNPDFNYILHTAPTDEENRDYYLWHLQILPRAGSIAGFELGSGIYITTGLPEETAGVIRTLMPRTGRVDARTGRRQTAPRTNQE